MADFRPVLTPFLSDLRLALVTPAKFEVGRHLIEGAEEPPRWSGTTRRWRSSRFARWG